MKHTEKKAEMANKMYNMNGKSSSKGGERAVMNGKDSGYGKGMKPDMHGKGKGTSSKVDMNGPHSQVPKSIYKQNGTGSTKAGGEGYKM